MADELKASVRLNFTKGAAHFDGGPASLSLTVSGTHGIKNIANVATSDTTLSKGSISTIGYAYFENLDATNFVTIGSDGAVYPIKLKAAEAVLLRFNGTNVHAKADTAAVDLAYTLIED